jgi:superfamily II DNA/RNA helicase
MHELGVGTERLEAVVKQLFPDAITARMDADTMAERGAHERVLAAFRKRHIDVLIGTQMIAKGLDFPDVTLVGVVSADTGLFVPDYRAAERTFQLLSQVAGRAGRADKAGKAPSADEARWNPVADLMMTMAPDVGTSTNINPAMDEKIFGPRYEENWEAKLQVSERLRPELAPREEASTRHIRFEIAEANCMSALGSFGKMGYHAGIPFLPLMTVYDFFIKRALDQLYYDLYWGSSFVLVGTPSGIT